jgi:hypothetical protein
MKSNGLGFFGNLSRRVRSPLEVHELIRVKCYNGGEKGILRKIVKAIDRWLHAEAENIPMN